MLQPMTRIDARATSALTDKLLFQPQQRFAVDAVFAAVVGLGFEKAFNVYDARAAPVKPPTQT
jgi:hypothetical protein